MSNASRFRRIIASVLAVGMVAPIAPPAASIIGSESVVAAAQAATKGVTTSAPAPLTNAQVQAVLDRFYGRPVARRHEPIWVARGKRGARKSRSRWNYNRAPSTPQLPGDVR